MVRRAVRESLIHVRGALDDAADITHAQPGAALDIEATQADDRRVSVVAESAQVA
jgi:hypothetical protein